MNERCPNWPDKKTQCTGELIPTQDGPDTIRKCSKCNFWRRERFGLPAGFSCELCGGPMFRSDGYVFCAEGECPNHQPAREVNECD